MNRRCKACNSEIENNAVRCPYCREYQGVNIVKRIVFLFVVLLFSFVLYLWFTT